MLAATANIRPTLCPVTALLPLMAPEEPLLASVLHTPAPARLRFGPALDPSAARGLGTLVTLIDTFMFLLLLVLLLVLKLILVLCVPIKDQIPPRGPNMDFS